MNDLPFLKSPLRTHGEVIERAKEIGRVRGLARVVVAAAEEDDILAAMYACRKDGISSAILVGVPERIHKALAEADVPVDTFRIIETSGEEESARKAAELAGAGEADIVMKGFLKTSILLKTLLKHEYGLRDRELVSHSAVLYIPRYGKFLNVTNGGTLIAPTFAQKLTVLANGVRVLRSVGIRKPKVAVLGAAKKPRKDLPQTIEARRLAEVALEYWAPHLDIEGPLPLDLAVTDPEQLHLPRYGPVAGQADMLLVHSIEEANIVAKTLIQFGEAIFMGVIDGARVPISLVSRSDTMINKMSSVALAVCLADYQRRGFDPLPAIDPDDLEDAVP